MLLLEPLIAPGDKGCGIRSPTASKRRISRWESGRLWGAGGRGEGRQGGGGMLPAERPALPRAARHHATPRRARPALPRQKLVRARSPRLALASECHGGPSGWRGWEVGRGGVGQPIGDLYFLWAGCGRPVGAPPSGVAWRSVARAQGIAGRARQYEEGCNPGKGKGGGAHTVCLSECEEARRGEK